MDDLISIENLVIEAKKHGVDFGKGDPYNRLRYYTKMGWLPHMVRKKDKNGNTRGHYIKWALERLILIEELKSKGESNNEIAKKLKVKTRLQSIFDLIKTKEYKNQLAIYLSLVILVLIFASEVGIIKIGAAKNYTLDSNVATAPKQVVDSGSAFIAKNQKKLFIETPLIKNTYKVYLTFTQDYSPATRYWISKIQDYKGFEVELDAPVFNNSEFNWWVTN